MVLSEKDITIIRRCEEEMIEPMIETLVKISVGLLVILIIFVFPNKSRTWFKGYGACEFLGSYCYRKAIPRSDFKSLLLNEVEWYCNEHYDMKKHIRKVVNAEYKRGLQNKPDVGTK